MTINKKQLIGALQKLARVTPGRTTLPILTNVLFEPGDGCISMTASDLDIFMRIVIECVSKKGQSFALPAQKLLSLLSRLMGEDVQIDLSHLSHDCVLIGDRLGSTKFMCCGDPFPVFPKVNGDSSCIGEIGPRLLDVIYAASTDPTRLAITGVKFCSHGLVATNGARIAISSGDTGVDFILPRKAASIVAEFGGDISVIADSDRAMFKCHQATIVCNLIQCTFPALEPFLGYSAQVKQVDACEFRRLVVRAGDVADGFELQVRHDQLLVKATSAEAEFNGSINVSYDGMNMKAKFKTSFLREFLETARDEIVMDVSGPALHIISGPLHYIVMQLRS